MDGNRTQANDVKNRLFILVSAGMILPAAFLFCVVAGLPHVFVLVCIGLLASFLIRKPVKYSDRSIIYTVVFSLVLVVMLDMVFPMKGDRFFHIGRLLIANITVPLFLYLAVFATFYESSAYTLGFTASFSLIALMFGGDYRMGAYNHRSPVEFFQTFLLFGNFKIFFLVNATIVILMILWGFSLARKSTYHRSEWKFDLFKVIAYCAALVITAITAQFFLFMVKTYNNELHSLENFLIRVRYPNPGISGRVIFNDDIDLNTTIKADRKKNSRMTILRVMGSKIPPGYLRGKAYQFYSEGHWTVGTIEEENCKFNLNINNLAMNAFFIDKKPDSEGETLTIYPSSNCYADFLFIPGNTEQIDMVADRLLYTENGIFTPKRWESDGGYTIHVPKIDQFAAFERPPTFNKLNYLHIPDNLKGTLSLILSEIKTTSKPTKSHEWINMTDREIAQRISQFFSNFTYTLTPDIPPSGEDPLKFFLTKSRKGHCELFASSAALLLRKSGIPTRYITGFVCHTEHPSGQYYVARMGDAHAWVEAYLRDEKKWVIVETTPASSDETDQQWGFFEGWIDRLKYAFGKIIADARRGYVARSVLALLGLMFSFFWDIIRHPAGAILFSCLILFLIWKFWFSKKRKYYLTLLQLDRERRELQKYMRRTVKGAVQKTGVMRTSQMSLEEWIELLRNSHKMSQEELSALTEVIRDYNRLRFSIAHIPPQEVTEWKKRAANI